MELSGYFFKEAKKISGPSGCIFLMILMMSYKGVEICPSIVRTNITLSMDAGTDPEFYERVMVNWHEALLGSGSELHKKILKMWIVKKGSLLTSP